MNPSDLPFDAGAMLAGLRTWVECESPTFDAAAVNRMMGVAARDLAIMGAHIEVIPGRMGFGDCVRARFTHPDDSEPGILTLGHMDTVHPVGTLSDLPWRQDGARCYGPGILDMKGGNYLALEAVRQLLRAGGTALPIPRFHQRRGDRQPFAARPDRRGRAASLRACGPGPPQTRVVPGRYAIAR